MSKRERPTDDGDRPQKRSRQDVQTSTNVEEVHFARQLQDLLVFRQDGIQQLRSGIASFKAFLESILYHKDEDNRGRQISILREYLETQKPAVGQEIDRPFLTQLWQAWSFAAQNHNDHLLSSVSAIFALLLRTLSGILDLREHGLLLCRTVLQHQHVRLVKRSLDAPKHKDFVLSPTLRLLTEVSTFDGGVVAREVYKHREHTFDVSSIRRNLALVKVDISEEEARRKPAIRTLTLRYVLSLIKYLHELDKSDILKNRPLCNTLFQYIRDDPSDTINELLAVVEQNVLKNDGIPRSSKAMLLTSQTLERVTEIACREPNEFAAAETAFRWLTAVSTTPAYGILRRGSWYPPATISAGDKHGTAIDLGLDGIHFYDRQVAPDVRNPVLLSWIMTLRAHLYSRERKLLITCLAAAPELVAAYFTQKPMQLEAKLTNTWISYASLVFEITSLPIPDYLGGEGEWASLPPQTAIMLENILPKPLTQAILTRCLNQSSELITFFAIRLLVVAFDKFNTIKRLILARARDAKDSLWFEASQRLHQQFQYRCPAMKDVIAVLRKLPDDDVHSLQREAIVRLLELYYEKLPLHALEEQFDVSIILTAALTRHEKEIASSDSKLNALRRIELEHLLAIAGHSPGMKWLNKQGALKFSPLSTLLRIHRKEVENSKVRSLLQTVLLELGVLQPWKTSDVPTPLDALIGSLLRIEDDSAVWAFLDDCFGRSSKRPVKYQDDLEALIMVVDANEHSKQPQLPSILTAVFLEQAHFVAADKTAGHEKANWMELYLQLLDHTTDAGDTLKHLKKAIRRTNGWPGQHSSSNISALLKQVVLRQNVQSPPPVDENSRLLRRLAVPGFPAPPIEAEDHPELFRWSQKEVGSAIEDGDIDALVLCLCSEQSGVRRQAFTELRKLHAMLHSSAGLENSAQISLVIGELLETFEQQHLDSASPLSYLGGTFAMHALRIQTQPQHVIYPKLNRFLIRGPEWRVLRLPAYWLSLTILGLPDEDDAYWREVQWVLDWLVDGLRCPADLDILRKNSVFERILTFWVSTGAAAHKSVRDRIFELLFRVTYIDGGSDTLVTRTGILSWISIASKTESEDEQALAQALQVRIMETCDQKRLASWNGGSCVL